MYYSLPLVRVIQYAATYRPIMDASEYWIARRSLSSGAHSRDPVAGDDEWEIIAPSRREASEALLNLPPEEGVGNAGCPMHPRPRVQL
jgi:hypothetical protein